MELDLTKILGEKSKQFTNLHIDYKDDVTLIVTGDLRCYFKSYSVPYNGNIMASGFTENELVRVEVEIDEITATDSEGNYINDSIFLENAANEIIKETEYA